jgi:hypothetical protein
MSDDTQLIISGGNGLAIDLYPWLHGSDEGIEALEGITGFGLPGVTNRWFEGAGDGATWRGSRTLPREIDLPFTAQAGDRAGLLAMMSNLARILDPSNGAARLDYALPDGDLWFANVVREGGGDWKRGARKDSDKDKFVNSYITLKAGDSFWTRTRPEQFDVRQDTSGRGLMPYLAKLEVSSSGAFGSRDVVNIGDAPAWPIWKLTGPFLTLAFTGPKGEALTWSGNIAAGNGLTIDAKNGTVIDYNGVNRYDGLGPAPKFWTIAPGESVVSVIATGTSSTTLIKCTWQPRRWLVV